MSLFSRKFDQLHILFKNGDFFSLFKILIEYNLCFFSLIISNIYKSINLYAYNDDTLEPNIMFSFSFKLHGLPKKIYDFFDFHGLFCMHRGLLRLLDELMTTIKHVHSF